jgi:tRNA A-37 threonylcarbamoyl transferase component Bud32
MKENPGREPLSRTQLAARYFFSPGLNKNEDYDQFWIRYKPIRVIRKGLTDGQAKIVWALVFCLTVVTTYLLIMRGFAPESVILLLFLSIIPVSVLLAPTHIQLDADGITLHWLHSFLQLKSPLLAWDRLSYVSFEPTDFLIGGKQRALQFNFISRGVPNKARFLLGILEWDLCRGWFSSDRSKLVLRLDAVASSDDRKRLQMAIKKYLPSYRLDASVTDELNLPMMVQNYTDLWMDALSLSATRARESMLEAGTHLAQGRYEIVEQIGAGGQAIVYKAIERHAGRNGLVIASEVVLKEFVLPAHAGISVRKRVLEHIQQEAELLRSFKQAHIVKVDQFFVEDQRAYLVLEYISGKTLKNVVTEQGALAERRVIDLALQMCDILDYLHSREPKVVHRDFTPDNLMVDEHDFLKLIDFNVAQHLEADATKTVVGKHSYIPPEQFRGKASPQSDIYALGASLYFLLTNKEPEAISQALVREDNPAVSEELAAIVAKATAIPTPDRYQNCKEVRSDLLKLLTRYSDKAQPAPEDT